MFLSSYRPQHNQPVLFFPNIYKKIEDCQNYETAMLLQIPIEKIKKNDYQFKYRMTTDNPFKVLLNCFNIYDF